MTDQHLLTDETCERISSRCVSTTTSVERNNMRAAADWQLEQVLEWLKTNTEDYVLEDYYSTYFLIEAFLENLKQAMRLTTTTQEDNQ